MVVALPALWLVAVSIAFYLAARLILTPAIIGVLRRLPAIGHLLESAANGIVTGVESAISKWVRPHLATIVSWLKAAAIATLSMPLAQLYFGSKIEAALKHLVETKIAQLVHVVTDPIMRRVDAVAHAITATAQGVAALDRRLSHSIEQGLLDLSAELLRRFKLGIDTLRNDVFNHAVPALQADIAKVARGAEADIARVGKTVEGISQEIADLAKRLGVPLNLIESLIATVGIVAALDALTTLGKCSGKLRALCLHDADAWGDFLLATLTLLAFPGLRELTLMGESLIEDVSGVLVEIAES